MKDTMPLKLNGQWQFRTLWHKQNIWILFTCIIKKLLNIPTWINGNKYYWPQRTEQYIRRPKQESQCNWRATKTVIWSVWKHWNQVCVLQENMTLEYINILPFDLLEWPKTDLMVRFWPRESIFSDLFIIFPKLLAQKFWGYLSVIHLIFASF